jgi:aspartate/glutamate racemase
MKMHQVTEDDVLEAAEQWLRFMQAIDSVNTDDQQDLDLLNTAIVMACSKYKRVLTDYFNHSVIEDDDVRYSIANAMIVDEIAELLHGERK